MNLGAKLGRAVAVFALAGMPSRATAQEHPVQRVANIVSVAVEEYGKGIDDRGRLISAGEYQEAVGFLGDARNAATRLPGDRTAAARALLDTIVAAMAAKRPPADLATLNRRFALALGSEAALELPNKRLDVSEGQKLYEATCASCHGQRGMGDGPAAGKFAPHPTAIGTSTAMGTVTPAMTFRKISVGVTGTAMPAFAATLTADQRWNIVGFLNSLRTAADRVAEGEGLYAQNCVTCHGMAGLVDGTLSRTLSKLPPEIGSLAWQAERSDSQLAAEVIAGKSGTPMPPATNLTPAQVQSVVAYLRTLPSRLPTTVAISQTDSLRNGNLAAQASLLLLEQSLAAVRNDQPSVADDRATDAYMKFEPIESRARARDPGVVASMEKLFNDFKAAVRVMDVRMAERARDAIETNMPKLVDLTQPTGSASEAFFQSFLIILREGFEAILVIGAVVAFLIKTGHRERLHSIWVGIAAALIASAITAVVLRTVLLAIPGSKDIIEGITLLVAVGVLFSVSYWLISRVEAARWQQFIREKVNNALDQGGGRALAFVAFLAVYREGAETALFYQALFNEGAHVFVPITLGIVAGFAALAVIFSLFYKYGVRIPLRPFFSVTSVLLYYMAFVFLGTAVRELQEGNAVPISVIRGFPTVPALGIYPTWQSLIAQIVLLALFIFALAKTFWPKRSVTLPTMAPVDNSAGSLTTRLDQLAGENAALHARLEALERALTAVQSGQPHEPHATG